MIHRASAFAAILLLWFAPLGLAAEKPQDEPEGAARRAQKTAPNSSELALLPANSSIEGLEVVKKAGGVSKVHLQDRFRHALVMVIAPDGSRTLECIDSAERLKELLLAPRSEIQRSSSDTAPTPR